MDRLVIIFAPRGPFDFVFKVICFLLVFGILNLARDYIEHGSNADPFWNNLREASSVGILPTLLAFGLIAHLKNLQDDLKKAAITDPLTGLPNRRSFFDQANAVLPDPGGVMMMLDADHFKRVNDQFGHGAGDQCLIEVAHLLRAHLRSGDVVARLGGEEFGVFLVGARKEDARSIAERLAKGVVLNIDGRDQPLVVTLSIGAICSAGYLTVAELLSAADVALYEAKETGRARAVFAKPIEDVDRTQAIGPRDVA